MRKIYFVCLMVLGLSANATIQDYDLYIVSDSLNLIDNSKLPYKVFTNSASFQGKNVIYNINEGDTLRLNVHNTDSDIHHFQVKGMAYPATIIPANDSVIVEMVFPDAGSYIYYDPLNYPDNKSMGLAGMINVKDHSYSSFYWNIKDFQKSKSLNIDAGNVEVWNDYYPNYFTINSKSNPAINADTDARVTGSVGDTIYIYMVNTGQSIHSMHYHGYHLEIMHSSHEPSHVGRIKDTFPLYPMETLVLRLIPDKPGEYPVHDHNLVAVTANMVYPNGMFITLLIAD